MRRTHRNDSGVTIVEASFAIPILFLFVFGLVDLGMWTFNSNQATNAARDGARAGIVSFELADQEGSPDHQAVVDAVRDRLPDNTVDVSDITVECVQSDGTPIAACANAEVDRDRIRVEVEWSWDLVTPVAAVIGLDEGAARGSATMAIVGRPLSTAPPGDDGTDDGSDEGDETPGACTVPDLTVSPSPVSSKANQLQEDLWIEFTTNGSEACTGLRIELDGSKNNPTTIKHQCGCGENAPNHAWAYSGSNNIWQSGAQGKARIYNGNELLASDTFWVN